MLVFSRFKILFLIFPILLILGCSNPTEVNYIDSVYLAGTPVIKGYYITTNENPDGNGEYVGSPQYDPTKGNAFPNPYIEDLTVGGLSSDRFITFIHLPPTSTKLFIVKGISENQLNQFSYSYFGIPSFNYPVKVVKEISKQDNSPFARWDFRDENEVIMREGYFRAYIFGEGVPENTFVDFYILLGPDIIEHY